MVNKTPQKSQKKELISRIVRRLNKKNIKYLRDLSLKLLEKEDKSQKEYESIPAKMIIEGKKYHIRIFREKLNKFIPLNFVQR